MIWWLANRVEIRLIDGGALAASAGFSSAFGFSVVISETSFLLDEVDVSTAPSVVPGADLVVLASLGL